MCGPIPLKVHTHIFIGWDPAREGRPDQSSSVLQEAAERRHPSAGPDHNDGLAEVLRGLEVNGPAVGAKRGEGRVLSGVPFCPCWGIGG